MPGKARPSVCESILKEIYCWKWTSETKRKAVIELCEKNIPQKVIPNDTEPTYYWDAFCPKCGVLHDGCCNYCSECGQRLDWGDLYKGEEVKGEK